jgi:hypothetical protein
MTEPRTSPEDAAGAEDPLRQHTESSVEGPGDIAAADQDQPREHSEDPAEG